MKVMNKMKAKESLELASAMRAAQSSKDDYKKWRNDLREDAY